MMTKDNLKNYIIFFSGVFVLLLFVTWQQITVFRLGYKITSLKTNIRKEEIIKQQYMKDLANNWSLNTIDRIAKAEYGMSLPKYDNYETLTIDSSELFLDKNKKQFRLVAYIKDIFSISEAEAK